MRQDRDHLRAASGRPDKPATAYLKGNGDVDLGQEWAGLLRAQADACARLALDSIRREFPSVVCHTMAAPGDFPYRPRARTPVFYGSHDWQSCASMYWLLVRLLRVAGETVPAREIRAVIQAQFSPVAFAAEAGFMAGPDGAGQHPAGWGWLLLLAAELSSWDDRDSQRWAAAMRPLTEATAGRFLNWLAVATRPVRHGGAGSSAFGLSLALGYARQRAAAGDPALLDAITSRTLQWYAADMMYPAGWEPSGEDFLSPALTEAELMAQVLPAGEFPGWLSVFLPAIAAGQPESLVRPVRVGDPADPAAAHVHVLHASRAWCWHRIGAALPGGDPQAAATLTAARCHAAAVPPLPAGAGSAVGQAHPAGAGSVAVERLAVYLVLMLSSGPGRAGVRASGS